MTQQISGTIRQFRRAVVVVPAHNEESVLDACLSSVHDAADQSGVPTSVIVVLDACTDRSADIADAWSAARSCTVVAIEHRNVGAARAAGFRTDRTGTDRAGAGHAASEYGTDTWYATTDADSVVRPDWLSSQLAHAERGARVVAGTVLTDLGDGELAAAYRAGYRHRQGHGHIHGANLGIRADTYWGVGGFRALVTAEDVDMVRRLEQSSVPVLYSCDAPVTTSNRRIGRAPHGFASHLAALENTTRDMAVAP